jgi:hypothetical protein
LDAGSTVSSSEAWARLASVGAAGADAAGEVFLTGAAGEGSFLDSAGSSAVFSSTTEVGTAGVAPLGRILTVALGSGAAFVV